MNELVAGAVSEPSDGRASTSYLGESILQAISNTEICVFMYYPQQHRIEVPKSTCDKYLCSAEYENMPASFADDFVHDDDRQVFFELYQKIDQGAPTASARFHSKDRRACCQVTLTELSHVAPGGHAALTPREVMGVIEDVSEWDRDRSFVGHVLEKLGAVELDDIEKLRARDLIASAISEHYYGLVCIDLCRNKFVSYSDSLSNGDALGGDLEDCVSVLANYIEDYIEPEDQEMVRAFAQIPMLAEVLRYRKSISCEYRRKGVGWTRGQFIVARRDENGEVSDVVFAAADINAEKTLESSRRAALYESQHDQLTGAFNRKAFDAALSSDAYEGKPLGFAIVDIDHFKEINDGFGHEAGDAAIAAVAKALSSSFRENDQLYRIGGDEFVILLPNATSSGWPAFCKKIQKVHVELSGAFSAEVDLTLSTGVCFSSSGMQDWMYRVADEALFVTKRNGRAGCTLMSQDGAVLDTWRDDEATVGLSSAMEGANAGATRFEIPDDCSVHPRFFCSAALKEAYGLSNDMSPEECFDAWLAGVDEAYLDVVQASFDAMQRSKNVECSFLWARDGVEPFLVRSVGAGEKKDGVLAIYGVHRPLMDAVLIEKKDDSRLIIDAQNGVYITSCYLDVHANQITALKLTSGAQAVYREGVRAQEVLSDFNMQLIDDSFHEKMGRFIDLETLPERLGGENSLDCDFLSTTDQGWCRASWLPVKRDANQLVTHALFVVAKLDAAKEAEIIDEQATAELMGLHYEAAESVLNSKILAMVLFSRDTGDGRAWTNATGFSQSVEVNYDQLQKRDLAFAPRDEQDKLAKQLDFAYVVEKIDEAGAYDVSMAYEVSSDNLRCLVYHFSPYKRDPRLLLAVVEDATDRMSIERSLAAASDSLQAALKVSKQMIWEYDPSEHVAVCFTEENAWGLPRRIENYPESLARFDMFKPEDSGIFKEAIRKIDEGADEAHCDVRIIVDGQDQWVSCALYSRTDPVLKRRFATLFVMDISLRVAAMRSFEERMESLLYADESLLKAGIYNLNKNEVVEICAQTRALPEDGSAHSLDETLAVAAQGIVGAKERQEYLDLFSREGLLALVESGQWRRAMECMYRVEPGRTEWVEASAELVVNPTSADVEVVGRIRSINELYVSNLLIKQALKGSFSSASILLDGGNEYYLFDAATKSLCAHRSDYWTDLENVLDTLCDRPEKEKVLARASKEKVLAAIAAGQKVSVPFAARFADKAIRLTLSFSAVDAEKGLMFVTLRDITDRETLKRLWYDARHDALTGLYNRRATFARCEELLAAHPDQTFMMIKLDVRRFRMFNAFFGEKVGDELLCAIARMLKVYAQDYECCAYGRIDSDVFCFFCPQDDAVFMRHVQHVKEQFAHYRDDFRLEPSVGVYVVDDRSLPVEGMFARASSAAKEGGTMLCEFVWCYNGLLEQKLKAEVLITNEMQSALDQGQFVVYLQPKFNARTGQHAGAEALVRWRHPVRGMISPGVFIPVFERNGFITTLDQYMWEQVCILLRTWLDEGRKVQPISVNVSRVSANSPMTVDFLISLVKRYRIDPSLLELELTESVYIDNPEELTRGMRTLQSEGFRILMDDFGSGYSSLNTLRNLPIDVLKLDMGFLSGLHDDERGRTIVSSVLEMTKRIGLPVIAEGVENEGQADFLREAGCDYVQGYLFARPMPVSEYEAME